MDERTSVEKHDPEGDMDMVSEGCVWCVGGEGACVPLCGCVYVKVKDKCGAVWNESGV